MPQPVVRYHPMLVALHWLVALAVIGNLAVGLLVLEGMANTDPAKPGWLRLHMASGIMIAVLLVIRLVTRLATAKPPVPNEGPLRWLAIGNHWALYLVTFAVAITGLGTAQLGGLFPILEGKSIALPQSFDAIPPFAGHALFSTVLLGLIALHFVAALWHAFAQRDNVLPRMWFGARRSD